MDKLEIYRNIIEKVINEYAAIPYAYGDIESRTMFDREKDSYMLYSVGWNSRGRIHGSTFTLIL